LKQTKQQRLKFGTIRYHGYGNMEIKTSTEEKYFLKTLNNNVSFTKRQLFATL
jgi:hypothetical protein